MPVADGPSLADLEAMIPHQTDPDRVPTRSLIRLRSNTLLQNDVYGFAMDDPRAQAFAMLRSRVLRYVRKTNARLIAVTSAKPREGKSFVALNLAAALSHIYPTWLIDADLRHPTVAHRLGFKPRHGLDTFLDDGDPVVPLRCTLTRDLLTLVTIREPRADSARLLASPRATELFATLRTLSADAVCIIDTPPVLAGDDMLILAPHLDAVIVVVEEGRTLRAEVRETLRILHPTPLLGTVLNRTLMPDRTLYYDQYPDRPPA